MNKLIIITASILGALSIVLGAFGAHGLKKVLDPVMLTNFETGVKYQMYHALFLLLVGSLHLIPEQDKKWIYILTLAGVLFFSGSIYLLSTKELTGFSISKFGIITPIGGLMLISAWIVLIFKIISNK